jgi:hypothetical protein
MSLSANCEMAMPSSSPALIASVDQSCIWSPSEPNCVNEASDYR